jgi:hypothetical protein
MLAKSFLLISSVSYFISFETFRRFKDSLELELFTVLFEDPVLIFLPIIFRTNPLTHNDPS